MTVAMNLIVSMIVVAGLAAVCLLGYFAAHHRHEARVAAPELAPELELERAA